MSASPKEYLKPLLAIIFWGMSFIATKIALETLAPLTIMFFRLVLSLFILIPIALYTKRSFSVSLKTHGLIFLLALIAVVHLFVQITGLKYTSATNTGWIIGITPVFMAILGFLVFRERLRAINTAGIIIAFAGLVLLISRGHFGSIGFISNKGDLLVLASTITWSVYSIINKKITLHYPPMMTILYSFLFMVVIISPFVLNTAAAESVSRLPAEGWAAVLFLGIFCSGVGYVLWAYSLKEMGSSKAGVFLYLEPFVTVFTAWIILGETITPVIILSGLIITSGVVLVNLNRTRS